jgi:glutathione S-transferase
VSTNLTLHELTGSPNNVKARIALGYKGLQYDRKPLDLNDFPGNRESVVKLSRQPRLPVLQHGQTVIFDSGAILRYLEANFPDTPPIFVSDYAAHGEIEQWEVFSRTQIGEPIGMMFGQQPTAGRPDRRPRRQTEQRRVPGRRSPHGSRHRLRRVTLSGRPHQGRRRVTSDRQFLLYPPEARPES